MARQLSRREFVLGGINACVAAGLFHSTCIETFWPEVNVKRVKMPYWQGEPIRLLHIADLHAYETMPMWYLENVLQIGLSQKPDLICVTGDFISIGLPDIRSYAVLLRKLALAAPTFACLGNHDGGVWTKSLGWYDDASRVLRTLADAGIPCLKDEQVMLNIRGNTLSLAGTKDLWSEAVNPRLLRSVPPKVPSIVMAHNPDTKDFIEDQWQLMLSGHTHGGQFTWPLLGGTPFIVVKDTRYIRGLNRWNDKMIHTSRGVGSSRGIRINCPPEITTLLLSA